MRYLPLGRIFASMGVFFENLSKRSRAIFIPALPAIASRWMTAFVEPPKAKTAAIVLLKEVSRKISRGFRSSQTVSTMRRPERLAILGWLESTAGIDVAPGRVKPSTSVRLVIVDAVP